jgi:hypothetical protein
MRFVLPMRVGVCGIGSSQLGQEHQPSLSRLRPKSRQTNADVERVDVPTDMAVPLALIVNELVTNARGGQQRCRRSSRASYTPSTALYLSQRKPGRVDEDSAAAL